jgi:hypothetical protein
MSCPESTHSEPVAEAAIPVMLPGDGHGTLGPFCASRVTCEPGRKRGERRVQCARLARLTPDACVARGCVVCAPWVVVCVCVGTPGPWCLLGVRSCHSRSTDMTMPSSSVPSASGLRQKIFASRLAWVTRFWRRPRPTRHFSIFSYDTRRRGVAVAYTCIKMSFGIWNFATLGLSANEFDLFEHLAHVHSVTVTVSHVS